MAKKTRITKAISAELTDDILSATLPALVERYAEERFSFLKELMAHFWTPDAVEKLKAVPKVFGLREKPEFLVKVDNNSSIRFNVTGDCGQGDYSSSWKGAANLSEKAQKLIHESWTRRRRSLTEPMLVPIFDHQHSMVLKDNDDLLERLRKHQKAGELFTRYGITEKRNTIMRTVAEIGFIEDVEERWPEIWEMARKYLPSEAPRAVLPVVSSRALNIELGLPVDSIAA